MEKQPDSVAEEASEEFGLRSIENGDIGAVITREEFVSLIGENADRYLTKFKKFYVDGDEKFAFTWHWPAFFLSITWMVYRKLYGWALVFFLLSLIPFLGLLLWPVFGLTGNYLYYKHAKKKIVNLKSTQAFSDPSHLLEALAQIGGVNVLGMIIAIVVGVGCHIFYQIMIRQ
jgi:hypothetical protein